MSSDISPQDAVVLGRLIPLIRDESATTRPALEHATGLGRRVVADRLRQALTVSIIEEGGFAPSDGGRSARTVRIARGSGVILSAQLGRETLIAVCDLNAAPLLTQSIKTPLEEGPDALIAEVVHGFKKLLQRAGGRTVWAVGVAVPGPVDVVSGRLVQPAGMPGWDDADIRSLLRAHLDAPIWVDNDANLMALAEYRHTASESDRDLLYVKVGTTIGSGLISNGRIHHGAAGAAGEIGHVRARDTSGYVCRCGLEGCLETVAAGWAVARRLSERAPAESPWLADIASRRPLAIEDVVGAIENGDPLALEVIDHSSREVGDAVANIVNFANPGTVVLGGGAARLHGRFFDGFRSALLARTVPLAARGLHVRTARLDHQEGLIGAALMAADQLFSNDALAVWLPEGSPRGQAARLHQLSR
jgi:predicted NBD/HSP70 family sugar kinase